MARKQTIFDVISTGDPARVRRKLARDPAALGERDENGLSPVMRAVYEARPDIVEVLLDQGRRARSVRGGRARAHRAARQARRAQ